MAVLSGSWVQSLCIVGASSFALLLSSTLARCAPSSFIVSNYSIAPFSIESNGLPKGWGLRILAGRPNVKIIKEKDKNILRLRSKHSSIVLYKDLNVDLKIFPYLKWRWKVTKLPEGADARLDNRDDQAAGIYIAFPRFPKMINTQLLAYIWETSAPVGTSIRNKKNSAVHYIVIRSGKSRLNEWITEERNVMEDYRKVFGKEPPIVGRVAILIDSDDTHSQAESFFERIEFIRQPHVQMWLPGIQLVKSTIPAP